MPPASRATERLRRIASRARTLAVIYLLVLFTATHYPSVPNFANFTWSDKVEHFTAYGLLTFFVLLGWELTIGVLEPKHYFAVWLAGTLYGAMDEVTQPYFGRDCDINDWAADVIGIVIGLCVFCWVRRGLYRLLMGRDAGTLGAR